MFHPSVQFTQPGKDTGWWLQVSRTQQPRLLSHKGPVCIAWNEACLVQLSNSCIFAFQTFHAGPHCPNYSVQSHHALQSPHNVGVLMVYFQSPQLGRNQHFLNVKAGKVFPFLLLLVSEMQKKFNPCLIYMYFVRLRWEAKRYVIEYILCIR